MASERDKENKNREQFHANAYPVDPLEVSAKSLEQAERAAKAIKTEDKTLPTVNHDVLFLTDEEFQKEVDHLPMTVHSNVVLLLGPAIKAAPTKSGLMLDERSVKQKQAEELDEIPSGLRVIAISQDVPPQSKVGLNVGDYAYTFSPVQKVIMNFQPLNKELAYYEVRTTDMRYSQTQEQVAKFRG